MNTRFFAALRMTTLLVVLLFSLKSNAQKEDTLLIPKGVIHSIVEDAPKYKYYFLEIRTTGKMEVEITPELEVTYPEIDSLIVSKRKETKKSEHVTGKKYKSYSEAFNALSNAGLEFVQFANLSTVGGGTAILVGDVRTNYVVWRKRVE